MCPLLVRLGLGPSNLMSHLSFRFQIDITATVGLSLRPHALEVNHSHSHVHRPSLTRLLLHINPVRDRGRLESFETSRRQISGRTGAWDPTQDRQVRPSVPSRTVRSVEVTTPPGHGIRDTRTSPAVLEVLSWTFRVRSGPCL